MTLDEMIAKVAMDNGMSKALVGKIYRGYWRAVREHISSLPLKDDLTDDEFKAIRPNVNIPSIGKLYVTLDRYKSMKRLHNEYLKKKSNATH